MIKTSKEIIALARALAKLGVIEFAYEGLTLKFSPTASSDLGDAKPFHNSSVSPSSMTAGDEHTEMVPSPQSPPSPEDLEQAFYELSLKGI